MPTQNIHVITGVLSLEDLCEQFALLQKKVRYLQNKGIDSENVREIGGYLVSDTLFMSLDGDVGFSSANDASDPIRIWAGSIDKDSAPWRVHKSGKSVMTGALIQSKNGTYPYVKMDPDSDLFGAYASATNRIVMGAYRSGRAYMDFIDGANSATVSYSSGAGLTISTNYVDIQAILFPSEIRVANWYKIARVAGASLEYLQDVLDEKATSGRSTGFSGGHNHGIPDGTMLAVAGGGSVMFSSAPQHTHAQLA